MKTVSVPDDFCTTCTGTGTRALHGIAITEEEFHTWSEEMVDDYFSGGMDTTCEICRGAGRVDPEIAADRHEEIAQLKAEAPHMFV